MREIFEMLRKKDCSISLSLIFSTSQLLKISKKMSQLNIYRASAGSGKTFTLTLEYIKLLFANPTDYRHILAVTFTNKATSEMRLRILESLHQLSGEDCNSSDYMKELREKFKFSEKQVRARAKQILGMLLHDYSHFSVSTIDRFFQQIVRSFAREAGLLSTFRLELQPNQIMTQAIEKVILEMNLPENAELKRWLVEFAESKMEEDKGWDIAREIYGISEAIYSETYQANALELSERLADKSKLRTYREQLRSIISETDKQLKDIGAKGLKIIESYGLDILEDFSGKSRSKVKIFLKMDSLKDFIDEKSYKELIDNPDKWIRKDTAKETQNRIFDAYNAGLNKLLHEVVSLIADKSSDYFTAQAILENLNALGIVNDVSLKINELCRDNNLFLISGTNHLLNRIIDDNETPFLYEKTGTRYSHFMIDEFQDTSTLQYKNFMPLISESLANNKHSLLVGDVKQAIYRWRNSDWNLLAEKVENDFNGYGTDVSVLVTNWRSSGKIIHFNNDFFADAPRVLQDTFNNMIPETSDSDSYFTQMEHKIVDIYADVEQKVAHNKAENEGDIYIRLFEGTKAEIEETILTSCVGRIAELIDAGYELLDICVLVRKNSEGILITNALLSGEYHPQKEPLDVISSESLLLSGSEAVKLIVAQLKYLQNPNDLILESFIKLSYYKHLCKNDNTIDVSLISDDNWADYKEKLFKISQKPLYELVNSLVGMLSEEESEANAVYLQSFLSVVLNYIGQENADLNMFLDYWENQKERLSLSIPENQDAIRVMTIHKSKGLEFKAVVLPFFTWELKESKHNLLWVKPECQPFDYLTLVPVTSKKDLIYSHFSREYLSEIMQQYVDNLNIAYVALTRAKDSLSVFASIQKIEKESIKTIADILYLFVCNEKQSLFWNSETLTYKNGIAKGSSKDRKQSGGAEINKLLTFPFDDRIAIHLESDDYVDDERAGKQSYGKIMHRLFESIVTKDDVDKSLKELRNKGIITFDELKKLKEQAMLWLSHPKVAKWFDGSYDVKTEAEIISKSNKRPDRVMFGENEVIVVDYKFGEIKSPHHQRQVKEYIRLIRQMGYDNVTGFLWYVSGEEVEEVEN